MTPFASGAAARLAVLVIGAGLALTWVSIAGSPAPAGRPAASDRAPTAQSVLPGAVLAPLAVTTPPSKAGMKKSVRSGPKQKRVGSKARTGEQRRRAQSRDARAAVRGPFWRNAGGRDIGWPQCPTRFGFAGRYGLGQPMPDPGVGFVIVGLTNGRAFTPNPCLRLHLNWVRKHQVHASAYAFAAFPSRADLRRHRANGPYDGRRFLGALKNAGHAAARYNIRVMKRHGFVTPHVWLDVEPSSSRPWSGRKDWNRAVIRGWVRSYRQAGYTVGFYSTPSLWRGIAGRMRLGLPEWRTAGPASPKAALARCRGESIQGGRAVMAQWWTARRDFDRICPGQKRSTIMERYFHQW